MAKKGFVHLLPLIVVALIMVGGLATLSVRQERKQKEAVGKVLSSSDSGDDRSGGDSGGDKNDRGESSGGSSGSSNVKIEQRTDQQRTRIETKPTETKVEIRNEQGRFETRIGEDRQETRIRSGNLRIEIRTENGQVTTRVKNENNEEVELEDEEEDELLDEIEEELEDKGIRVATGGAQLGFIQNGRKVRTNFPLSVNAATGELFVTTPAGEKAVAVLPDQAIANMIKAGILTRVVEEPVPLTSPAPGEGTAGATVAGASIELTALNNKPVFEITGVKSQRLLGIVPIDIRRKTVVSAEDGQLLDIQEGLFARFLDLLSL